MKTIKFIIFLIIILGLGGIWLFKLLSDHYYTMEIASDKPGPELNSLYNLRKEYRLLKIRQYELYSVNHDTGDIDHKLQTFQDVYYDLYKSRCKEVLRETDFTIKEFHPQFKIVDDLLLPTSVELSASGFRIIRDPFMKIPYTLMCHFYGSNATLSVDGVVKFPFFKTLNKELLLYKLFDKN